MEYFDDTLTDRVISSDQLRNYIAVAPEEKFVYDFVFSNCSSDLTPPLYYCILHTICSFFPGMLSKWFGLSINLVAYFVTLIFLYQSSLIVYRSRWVSTLVTLCYGFSTGGLNCVTYVRMYGMVTMWSVLVFYFILRVIRDDDWKHYIAAGVFIYLGFITQYNFGILAFFLCASACVVLLCRKHYKKLFFFGASAMSGVVLFLLTWPSMFSQSGKVVSWTGDNGKDSVGAALAISFWGMVLYKQYKVQLIILAILFVSIVILKIAMRWGKRTRGTENAGDANRLLVEAYAISLSGFILGTIGIAYFAPYFSARYCYNVMPFLSMIMGFPFMVFRKLLAEFFAEKNIRFSMNVIGGLFVMVMLLGVSKLDNMQYLYLANPEKLIITESVSDYPCFFITTNREKAIINSIDHLIKFKEIYVTDDFGSDNSLKYLNSRTDKDAIVVYVDTDPISSSGLNSDEVMNYIYDMGLYDTVLVLYELDSATAFLLCNNDSVEK